MYHTCLYFSSHDACNTDTETSRSEPVLDLSIENPSDPGHFSGMISDSLREAIVNVGPCQPPGPFAINHQGRRFQLEWYQRVLQSKEKVSRDWLVYSPKTNNMYCFSCWLFSKPTDPCYEGNWSEPEKGVYNYKRGLEKIRAHEASDTHIFAYTKWKCFLKGSPRIDSELKRLNQLEIEKNRQIVQRLLDCILFLAKQNLSLRGHRESDTSSNRGNFIELVHLIAKYDPLLASHLESNKKKQVYLSPGIQNDFLKSIHTTIITEIINEVKEAKYFSLLADTTTDISHRDQFSLCLRYVDKYGDINERFISFTTVPDGSATASTMEDMVLLTLNELGLDVCNIRGQSYDGASNMSGAYNGLQAKFKEHSKTAFYVWCSNHRLNLILVDAANCIVEAKTYFGISDIYNLVS